MMSAYIVHIRRSDSFVVMRCPLVHAVDALTAVCSTAPPSGGFLHLFAVRSPRTCFATLQPQLTRLTCGLLRLIRIVARPDQAQKRTPCDVREGSSKWTHCASCHSCAGLQELNTRSVC